MPTVAEVLGLDVIPYRLEFLEPVLGTAAADANVYSRYIAAKAFREDGSLRPDVHTTEEAIRAESGTLPEDEEGLRPGYTVFHRDEKGIFVYNYWIRGFLKSAAQPLGLKVQGKRKEIGLTASVVDQYVFPFPRKIRFQRDGKPIVEPEGALERPLRAMTALGPRVSLARSDIVREGATLEFELRVVAGKLTEAELDQLFAYGALTGLGQWRNASWGRFKAYRRTTAGRWVAVAEPD